MEICFKTITQNCVQGAHYVRLANKTTTITGTQLINFGLGRGIPIIPELLLINYAATFLRDMNPVLLKWIMVP